jgi:hypothetical protein
MQLTDSVGFPAVAVPTTAARAKRENFMIAVMLLYVKRRLD